MEAWDEDLARAVISQVVDRKAGMFSAFPEHSLEDLRSEGLIAARAAWPKYNRLKAKPQTYIYRVAACRLIDMARKLSRERNRVISCADAMQPIEPAESDADWLEDTYLKIRRNFTNYGVPLVIQSPEGGRRPICDRAQATALIALKRRLDISCRETSRMLRTREDFRAAVGLKQVPSYRSFCRIEKSVTKLKFTFSPRKTHVASGIE
jgi:hypothetical protein